jgi:hypothetical protein
MRTTKHKNLGLASLALVALSIVVAPIAKAECGTVAHNSAGLSPALRSLPEPAAEGEENGSNQADSPDADHDRNHDSRATILGLWKKIYYSGGVLNDIGLDQFSAGGTELLNDVGAFNTGNSFCIGVWKQVGPRTYDLVHTFYVFDPNNAKIAIGVSIETSRLVVSRDGNRFTGKWTQDNFDLYGTLVPGTHFDGTITATRIAPGLGYPFPLPL